MPLRKRVAIMLDKLLFGRYIQGSSLVHRLDPRAKLIGAFYFIIVIFLANNWQTYLIMTLFTFLCVILSDIKLSVFLNGVKPLIWLILFTVLLQILFTRGGETYLVLGPISITSFGVINGAFIFMRFVLIIFISTLLTLTTMPLSLTDAIEKLLGPLKRFKVPVHEIALMLSIALRFVPTLMDEASKMNKLVKNLLTLNQLESGKDAPVMERFDIVSLIRGVLGSMHIMIEQKEATVIFEETEPVYVFATFV